MQQEELQTLLSEARAQTKATRDEAADLEHFLGGYPPLKLANITLTGPVRPPNPMYEVVSPGYRRAPLSPAVRLKTLALARSVQQKSAQKKRTFGRGELKIV